VVVEGEDIIMVVEVEVEGGIIRVAGVIMVMVEEV
jgi:hypothetical protein